MEFVKSANARICQWGVSIVLAAGVLLWSVPQAQAKQRMLVLSRGVGAGADKAAAFAEHFTLRFVQNDPRYQVVSIAVELGGEAETRAKEAFTEAQDLFGRARVSYESLELDSAIEMLNAALAKYERNAGFVEDLRPVADARMLLAASYILLGDEARGEAELTKALTIFPHVEPDPRIYNPGMRKIFDRQVDKHRSAPTGSLTIESNPGYGEVYVDGEFVGAAPVSIDGIAEGQHYIRVVRAGYRPFGQLAELRAKESVKILAALKATEHYDTFDALVTRTYEWLATVPETAFLEGKYRMPSSLDKLGQLLKADQVLVVASRADGGTVTVSAAQFDLKTRKLQKIASQVFGFDARPAVYAQEIGALMRTHFSEQALYKPTYKNANLAKSALGLDVCTGIFCDRRVVALVSAGGVGLAMMGLGGGLWALAHRDQVAFHNAPQNTSKANSLKASAYLKARVGDTLFALGAASTLVGLGLYLFWHPSAAKPDGDTAEEDEQVRVWPMIVPNGAGLGATVRF